MMKVLHKWLRSRNINRLISYHEKEARSWGYTITECPERSDKILCIIEKCKHDNEVKRLMNELEKL